MSLSEIKEDIIELVEENLEVIASGYPMAEVGDTFEDVAKNLEALGCCKLLLELDADRLHRDLVWAGYARRYYLQRCQVEKHVDFRHARSRCNSFFCAIAAGDMALAAQIGALSPEAWMPDGEYEEDFAYFRFVHLLLAGADPGQTAPLVEQIETVQGKPSPRLSVVQAFQAGDAAAFEAAFTALADARNDQVDAQGFMGDPSYRPRASVFVEGLALLRLAEIRRLGPKRREYPRCPYTARATRLSPPPEDIFEEIERATGP